MNSGQSWLLICFVATYLDVKMAWRLIGSSTNRAPHGDDHGHSLPPAISLTDGAEFEYIVVGAGAAGAAAAARLALAGRHVLLVEAGSEPHFLSTIPGAAQWQLGTTLDWQYDTIPNNVSCLAYRGRQCRCSRGRCLGGSTSINYMMYSRATPSDFDDLNIPGWSWDDVYPFFLRFEGLQHLHRLPPSSKPYHNTTGPMRIEFFADSRNPWHSRLIEGYRALDVPFNPDVCAKSQIGVTRVVGYVYDNERMSTARAYLARPDVKKNLKVARMTRCTGVIFENDNEAKGITVVHGQTHMRLFAKKEVILSAGTIGTPHILMLSGIGPAEHLRKFNITVRADSPVGDHLVDHIAALAFVKVDRGTGPAQGLLDASETAFQVAELLLRRRGPLTSNGLTDVTAFLNSDCYDFERRRLTTRNGPECASPTVQYIHSYLERGRISASGPLFRRGTDLAESAVSQLRRANANHALLIVSPVVLRPRSTGAVRLASAAPLAAPAILPNLLADERDLEDTVRALLILEDLLETEGFARRNASLVALELDGCPRYSRGSRADWACYSRHTSRAAFHAAGTARLGVDGAAGAVGARLLARGARRVRVADLSVLPRAPRANTAAAAIMIGERVAQFILEDERDNATGGRRLR